MRIATVGEVTDRQTEGHTDGSDFIICPMLCYSNGTDKKLAVSNSNIQHYRDHSMSLLRTEYRCFELFVSLKFLVVLILCIYVVKS